LGGRDGHSLKRSCHISKGTSGGKIKEERVFQKTEVFFDRKKNPMKSNEKMKGVSA